MKQEIERKFLVWSDAWRGLAPGELIRQGYLSSAKERTVRVRAASTGFLTIKGLTTGATRAEYEYEIPIEDANAMLDNLVERPIIEKRRHHVSYGGFVWEVDEFLGDNTGLIMAEIELESEDQAFDKPDWVGDEVTHDLRYYNANLVRSPFTRW